MIKMNTFKITRCKFCFTPLTPTNQARSMKYLVCIECSDECLEVASSFSAEAMMSLRMNFELKMVRNILQSDMFKEGGLEDYIRTMNGQLDSIEAEASLEGGESSMEVIEKINEMRVLLGLYDIK